MTLAVYHDKRCEYCNGKGSEIDDVSTGRRVRERRKRAGLSLAELGALMGISEGYTSDLELAKRQWDAELIQKAELALKGLVKTEP